MTVINAIAKARFSSARPQRIALHKGRDLQADLLCLESRQSMKVPGGRWTYYVIAGTAALTVDGVADELPPGQMAAIEDHPHMLANKLQQRLVCLAVGIA